jgi:hypothetical protein
VIRGLPNRVRAWAKGRGRGRKLHRHCHERRRPSAAEMFQASYRQVEINQFFADRSIQLADGSSGLHRRLYRLRPPGAGDRCHCRYAGPRGAWLRGRTRDDGPPEIPPATLLEIYVCGYLNQVQSSRRLEQECARNLELIWLTVQLKPDFKTIADFRRDNGAAAAKSAGDSSHFAGIWISWTPKPS